MSQTSCRKCDSDQLLSKRAQGIQAGLRPTVVRKILRYPSWIETTCYTRGFKVSELDAIGDQTAKQASAKKHYQCLRNCSTIFLRLVLCLGGAPWHDPVMIAEYRGLAILTLLPHFLQTNLPPYSTIVWEECPEKISEPSLLLLQASLCS